MAAAYDMSSTKYSKCASPRIILAILGAAVIIAIGLAIGLGIGLRSRDSGGDASEAHTYKSGNGRYRFAAAVADAKLCSEIGVKVMAEYRGNAVDATVATVICDGAMNAHSAGIGGGAFFIYYNRSTATASVFDARETAPAMATTNMFVHDPSLSLRGGLAVAVPGELKGLWELHQRYGTVAWSKLLQPTIDMCKDGVPLTEAQRITVQKNILKNDTQFSYLFDNNGEVLPAGTKIPRPKLGQTLQKIAEEGVNAFYNGSLTDHIVNEINNAGGNFTRADLENYKVNITEPVTFHMTANNLTVYSMPPPGSGVVLEYILNILSGYNFNEQSISTQNVVLTYHRIVEALKFAYAKRTELGDPKFVDINELIRNMTSPEVGQEIRALIDDAKTHDTPYYGPTFYDKIKPGTAHFCFMDVDGNAVSITSTINTWFGAKLKGNTTGIIYNNEMDDFSTPNTTNFYGVPASPANFIIPGKRPLSSMVPSIFVNSQSGEVELVVGGAGGTMITTATALVAMNTLWFNMTVPAAVDAPRIHHQLLPPELTKEEDFPQHIVQGLEARGHKVIAQSLNSVVTAIHRTKDKMLEAASDYRKGGEPDGF